MQLFGSAQKLSIHIVKSPIVLKTELVHHKLHNYLHYHGQGGCLIRLPRRHPCSLPADQPSVPPPAATAQAGATVPIPTRVVPCLCAPSPACIWDTRRHLARSSGWPGHDTCRWGQDLEGLGWLAEVKLPTTALKLSRAIVNLPVPATKLPSSPLDSRSPTGFRDEAALRELGQLTPTIMTISSLISAN
jgi:hypothetical protein